MIIITTPGRSGSSLLTLFLSKCGFDCGSDVWFDKFRAGMENKETLTINATLLRHYVKGEKINPYYVWGDIYKLEFDVVKDPSFLVHTQLIKNWWKVRQDIQIIYLYRNPQEIVDSCKKLPEWTGPVYRLFPEMIEQKQDDFLRTVEKLQIPILKFKFPTILDGEFLDELGEWMKLPTDAKQIWKRLVSTK